MKKFLIEYYSGDPDTVYEYDDNTMEYLKCWNYSDSKGISFGYFQTTLDGGKEFVFERDTCHHDLTQKLARKIVGKAYASEDILPEDVNRIGYAINDQAAYKGRTFDEPKIVTTWHKVSSEKLYELLEQIGGIEMFADYTYVHPHEYPYGGNEEADSTSMNVIDYINSHVNYTALYDKKSMEKDIKDSYALEDWMIDTIREYNTPNSKLAQKTAKLGNMTIAQYNSLIRQEGKKSKHAIKENNMNKNKFQKEFSNYLAIMNEALKRNDFKAYDVARQMLDESIEERKQEKALMDEMRTNNFGMLNHIFEQQLPTLIKTNKRGVKNVIKTIKEDKNLLNQFNFYNAVKNQYKGKTATLMEANVALDNLAEIALKNIDIKTVKESNKKLRKVMVENGISPKEFVDDESKKLYECGHNILTNKKKTSNMLPLIESYHTVCEYMEKHKNDKVNEGKSVDELIDDFENKLKTNLNESEISFVQQITDFKTPIAEQRKEKLFNKFKNECIDKINSMLKEDSNNDELKNLGKQIDEMKFNKDSIVKDIAKLLEIRDILMDD